MPLILIEGARHSGKTFLIEEFFKKNTNPKIHYYKFQFAKYIDDLEMRDQEAGPGVHYFSIANVLTILELNQTLLKDHILVFDRCIFSAYVWSIYRERMNQFRLLGEFNKILKSDIYQNSKILYVERSEDIEITKREKDYFGNFENADREKELFERIFSEFKPAITDSTRNNEFVRMTNYFNSTSSTLFNEMLTDLINNGKES
jgi:thymidylate kinase